MKLTATVSTSLLTIMKQQEKRLREAVSSSIRDGTKGAKDDLRAQVVRAGLGVKLSRTWRNSFYPNKGMDAAGFIWSKAPKIISGFDKGTVIKSKRGFYLAIPTENAPKRGIGNKRITPSNFPEHRFGPLRFVYRRNKPSLLVIDNARASYSRKTGNLRGFRKASERTVAKGRGVTTVVMFILIPRVKLKKRLDSASVMRKWVRRITRGIGR